MSEAPRLLVTQHERVLTVRFNNPPRHFFDEQMSVELDDLTRSVSRDRTIGAVVFTGQDSTYLNHFDVPELLRGTQLTRLHVPYPAARALTSVFAAAARSRRLDRALRKTPAHGLICEARIYEIQRRLDRMDKVTIAAINGFALGMGCVFSLACDIRLIADDQHIGQPESAVGLLAAAGGTQRLVRMIGASRALELLLDGRWLSAAEAVDLGLVHRAVAPADLLDEANTMATRLARRSPTVNREIKRMIYDAGSRSFARAARMEAASAVTTLSTDTVRRGLTAYRDRLAGSRHLTDDAIKQAWYPVLEHGVPNDAGVA
jgi:enoyl-CoA hydratase/carnithine racemase